jgi:hypothetical protein
MKTFVDEFWSLGIPDEWITERYPECVGLHQPEGIGELQISASRQERTVTLSDLRAVAAEHIEAGAITHSVKLGDFDGLSFSYDVDDEYWSEWYLKAGPILLFATYSCAAEDEGKEDEVVEAVLETLRIRQTKAD